MKKQNGITLVSLVITIVLMLIVASTTIYTSMDRFEINKLKKMYNDIELLSDKVASYYLQYNILPVVLDDVQEPKKYDYTSLDFDKNINDNENYYIIDLEMMKDISLNYGEVGYNSPNTSDDVYIINEKTHQIYYVKGIEMDGVIYHTIQNDENIINDTIPPTKPEIKIIGGEQIKIGDADYYFKGATLELIPGISNKNNNLTTTYKVNDGEEKNILTLTDNTLQVKDSGTNKVTLKTKNEENGLSSTIDIDLNIINIGDYVNYNCTIDNNGNSLVGTDKLSYIALAENTGYANDQEISVTQDLKWRVLGIENDKLLLISANPTDYTLSLYGQQGFFTGVDEIENIAKLYGNGKGAAYAKSINDEQITGIFGIKASGAKYIYRFPINGEYMQYSTDNGVTWNDITTSYCQSFRIPWSSEIINRDNRSDEGIELIETGFWHVLPASINAPDYVIKSLIMNNEDGTTASYFIAGTGINCRNEWADYGINIVEGHYRKTAGLFSSFTPGSTQTYSIRPEVCIDSNITLTYNEISKTWDIS